MTITRSDYGEVLKDNTILYLPSCLIIEMMTRLYSQVSAISLSGNVHNVAPDLLILLRRLTANLKATADAYEQERIRFFIGDWREDKRRARRLFYNVMSRLGYMGELLGGAEKAMLHRAVDEMTAMWAVLDQVMEKRCESGRCGAGCGTCRYFRCERPDVWQQVMAGVILALDATAEYPDSRSYLILLCYNRIKAGLVNAVEALERRRGTGRRFRGDRILCLSHENIPITCPKCTTLTESLPSGKTDMLRPEKATGAQARSRGERGSGVSLRGCYPMPPSLAGIVR